MKAFVVGGFTEGNSVLDRVVDAACDIGIAADGESVTVYEARENPKRLLEMTVGQMLITHSAGAEVIEPGQTNPEVLAVFNGPEPRSPSGLISSASKKTFNHAVGLTERPGRASRLRILAGGAVELLAHPRANYDIFSEVQDFSTMRMMQGMGPEHYEDKERALTRMVGMSSDEFFPPLELYGDNMQDAQESLPDKNWSMLLPGKHDDLLINPKSVLRAAIGRNLR